MTKPVTNLAQPAVDAITITPSDETDLSAYNIRALYVGTGGNIAILTTSGTTVVFKNAVSGSVIPCNVNKVFAASTTASDIVGLV